MALWFAYQKVDVLGHEDVPVYLEKMSLAQSFEPAFEADIRRCGIEVWKPLVTAKGDEVEIAFVLVSAEAERHRAIVWVRWAVADRTFVR